MKKYLLGAAGVVFAMGTVFSWPLIKAQVIAAPAYHIENLGGWKHVAEKTSGPQGRDFKASLISDATAKQPVFLVEGYTAPHANSFTTLVQSFKPEPGLKRLRLSAEIKTEFKAGWAGLWMRVDTPQKHALHFDNMGNRQIQGQTPWRSYEVVLDVPPEADNISLGFLSDGQGKAWVRHLSYTPVDQQVPVTDLNAQAEQPQNLELD